MSTYNVVIIGGGISGLTSAYFTKNVLYKLGIQSRVTVLEKAGTCGGWIKSLREPNGGIVELGPRSLRASGDAPTAAFKLVSDLGLEKEVISIPKDHPAATKRYLYTDGQVRALPNAMRDFVKKGTFSEAPALSFIKEPFKRRFPSGEDESIFDFFKRRFNSHIAEAIIDPVTRGIYAGDCRKLSIKSCFPILKEYESRYGSIVGGMLYPFKPKSKFDETENPLQARAKSEKWAVWSFKDGLEVLPRRLAEHCEGNSINVKTNTECIKLELDRRGDGATNQSKVNVYCSNGEVIHADHVISGLFAGDLARVYPESSISKDLSSIEAVDVVVVNLTYRFDEQSVVKTRDVPSGFGHLIPSTEKGAKVLGITYDSCTFSQHDAPISHTISDSGPEKLVRFTVMIGGAWFSQVFPDARTATDVSSLMCERLAREAMSNQLGISWNPESVNVSVHPECIPQYYIGHSAKMDRLWEAIHEEQLPLSLVGCSYKGVSVLDCISNAEKAAIDLGDKITKTIVK